MIKPRKSNLKDKFRSLKETVKEFLSRKWVGNPNTTSKE